MWSTNNPHHTNTLPAALLARSCTSSLGECLPCCTTTTTTTSTRTKNNHKRETKMFWSSKPTTTTTTKSVVVPSFSSSFFLFSHGTLCQPHRFFFSPPRSSSSSSTSRRRHHPDSPHEKRLPREAKFCRRLREQRQQRRRAQDHLERVVHGRCAAALTHTHIVAEERAYREVFMKNSTPSISSHTTAAQQRQRGMASARELLRVSEYNRQEGKKMRKKRGRR